MQEFRPLFPDSRAPNGQITTRVERTSVSVETTQACDGIIAIHNFNPNVDILKVKTQNLIKCSLDLSTGQRPIMTDDLSFPSAHFSPTLKCTDFLFLSFIFPRWHLARNTLSSHSVRSPLAPSQRIYSSADGEIKLSFFLSSPQ